MRHARAALRPIVTLFGLLLVWWCATRLFAVPAVTKTLAPKARAIWMTMVHGVVSHVSCAISFAAVKYCLAPRLDC